jgi:hypothetical protein
MRLLGIQRCAHLSTPQTTADHSGHRRPHYYFAFSSTPQTTVMRLLGIQRCAHLSTPQTTVVCGVEKNDSVSLLEHETGLSSPFVAVFSHVPTHVSQVHLNAFESFSFVALRKSQGVESFSCYSSIECPRLKSLLRITPTKHLAKQSEAAASVSEAETVPKSLASKSRLPKKKEPCFYQRSRRGVSV